ncbi:MAG: hypothetical protein RLZZ165_2226 [Bacteroidota bacterium]|jgi:hypothetical protein
MVLACGSLPAQFDLQGTLLGDRIWSQRGQPANIMEGTFGTFRYGGSIGGYLGNTHATLKGVFAENGYIEEATKDRLVDAIRKREDVGAGYRLGLAAVNFMIGGQRVGVYVDDELSLYARFNAPGTLGLLLRGNGAYAGDTVRDAGIMAKMLRTRELSLGTGWKWGKLGLGVRLRLKQGIKMLHLADLNYSLYTSPPGTLIHAAGNYDLTASPSLGKAGLFQFQGFGAGLDLGMRYALGEKVEIDAAITDLGMTFWKNCNRIQHSVNASWEGFSIGSLLQDSLSPQMQHLADSIRGILLPDTVQASRTVYSPAVIRGNVTFHLPGTARLSGSVVYSPLAAGARTRRPMIGVTYQQEVVKGLTLGANVYGMGLDSYGFGAMGAYRVAVGGAALDVLLGSDNLAGLVAPALGRGMNLYAGIGVGF